MNSYARNQKAWPSYRFAYGDAARYVYSFVTKEAVSKKLFDEIAPKYADRKGGYTRIIKIGARRGDAAEMAIIELI